MIQIIYIIFVFFIDSYVRTVRTVWILWSFWSKFIFRTSKNELNHHQLSQPKIPFPFCFVIRNKATPSAYIKNNMQDSHLSTFWLMVFHNLLQVFPYLFSFYLVHCFLFGIYFYLKVKQYCSILISFHDYFHHFLVIFRVPCAGLVCTLQIKFTTETLGARMII